MPTIEEYFIFQLLQRITKFIVRAFVIHRITCKNLFDESISLILPKVEGKPSPRGARAPMNSPPLLPPPPWAGLLGGVRCGRVNPYTGWEILIQVEHI